VVCSSPHLRPLRRNDDGLLGALKVAHSHLGARVLELEILRGLDGEVDRRGLPSTVISQRAPVFFFVIREAPRASSSRIADECRRRER
jgi:hypothetical protein